MVLGSNPSAGLTASIIKFRQCRADVLPAELFSEPAWDLLLELFLADAEGRRITAREVADKSNISPGVMSRWLQHLSKIGYVVGDGTGDLDDMLTLSAEALQRMEQIIDRAHNFYGEATYSRTLE
jgi:DNA-binding MarR family transcriptional regulator